MTEGFWKWTACTALLALPAVAPGAALAQERDAQQDWQPGIGIDLFASTDADDTDVVKLAGRALLDYKGAEDYRGVVFEKAWFAPSGQHTREFERGYLDLADSLGKNWRWKARIGTDGHTVLGSASIRKEDWSREVFVEREMVETPLGVDRGIYYTFLGASFDFALDERNTITAMAGVQPFTGENTRYHLRGSFIHVLKPDWGLSAQLKANYYHSTEPGEFDYFSPRNYVQILPLLQLRRFQGGWETRLQGGYGGQRDSYSGWHESRYANLRIKSPRSADGWEVHAEIGYANTSLTRGPDYDYVMGSLGIAKAF